MNWKQFGKPWGKCEVCWESYKKGIQHKNSLRCYKLGIPLRALKVPLDEFVRMLESKGYSGKYSVFSFPLSLLCKGVIILYFESEGEMRRAIEELSPYVEESPKDKVFFDKFVNVEWVGGFNYRRGCPEYDAEFGDWRGWPT